MRTGITCFPVPVRIRLRIASCSLSTEKRGISTSGISKDSRNSSTSPVSVISTISGQISFLYFAKRSKPSRAFFAHSATKNGGMKVLMFPISLIASTWSSVMISSSSLKNRQYSIGESSSSSFHRIFGMPARSRTYSRENPTPSIKVWNCFDMISFKSFPHFLLYSTG